MTRFSTYDNWKLASPDDEPDYNNTDPVDECDCCGKKRPLTRTWAYQIETWHCEECSQ